MNTFIGIDPGGKNAFGWCVMEVGDAHSKSRLRRGTASDVGEVVKEVVASSKGKPIGVGIDAPLYWSYDGERQYDREIRRAVSKAGAHSATVGHINSLRGACLVQGVLAAMALSKHWPEIQITESHPKALLAIWPDSRKFIKRFSFGNDHERDAVLGAYAAHAHWQKSPGWVDWFSNEKNVFVPWCGRVSYWFPKK